MHSRTTRFFGLFGILMLLWVPQALAANDPETPVVEVPAAPLHAPAAETGEPAEQEAEPETAPEDLLGTTFTTLLASLESRGSCNFCSSSSQCQPICGGTPGFDFACIYDFYCGHRTCVCL